MSEATVTSPEPATTSPAPPTPSAESSSTAPETAAPVVRAKRFRLDLPSIGLRGIRVVAYRGSPDDAPGTRIQNRGPTASPRGPGGGVVPGEVGNLIITGHRTSHSAPFRNLPSVQDGDRVLVRAGGWVFDYRVTRTMRISFRSEASKARQTAPVPGHPGRVATRPMITLSTCATPEDHAAGNFWSDEFGNPEHRIDKVGVLVDVRPVEGSE
jgi:sortase A